MNRNTWGSTTGAIGRDLSNGTYFSMICNMLKNLILKIASSTFHNYHWILTHRHHFRQEYSFNSYIILPLVRYFLSVITSEKNLKSHTESNRVLHQYHSLSFFFSKSKKWRLRKFENVNRKMSLIFLLKPGENNNVLLLDYVGHQI